MWKADVVDIQSESPLIKSVKVLFSDVNDSQRTDSQVFSISNLNDLPRICYNQIAQHELIDNIAQTPVKLGAVDVSALRPKVSTSPTQDEIDRATFLTNYILYKKMLLAVAQEFELGNNQDLSDMVLLLKAAYKKEYRTILFT